MDQSQDIGSARERHAVARSLSVDDIAARSGSVAPLDVYADHAGQAVFPERASGSARGRIELKQYQFPGANGYDGQITDE
jgi:hypothetical protein